MIPRSRKELVDLLPSKETIKRGVEDHLINATIINLTANVLYGSFERVLGQTPEQVMHARWEGTLATYFYAGTAWGLGRDYVQRKLEGKPGMQDLGVGLWSFGFNMGLLEFLYRNTEHPHITAGIVAGASFFFGPVIGRMKDIGRDYIGREKKALPAPLQLSQTNKYRAAVGFTIASLAYTAAISYL